MNTNIESILLIIFFFIMIFNFLSYWWSVVGVFKSHSEMDMTFYRLLQITSIAIWLRSTYSVYNTIKDPSEKNLFFIISLILIQTTCLIVFWFHSKIVKKNKFSIAFSKDLPIHLIKEGLYKKVRHPFYGIYLLSYLSVFLLTLDFYLMILIFLMAFIYYKAGRFEEKKFSYTSLANEYEDYKKTTWMFFPKLYNKNK